MDYLTPTWYYQEYDMEKWLILLRKNLYLYKYF